MSTSGIGATLDAIRAGLAAVSGLSDVTIVSGAIGIEEAGQKCVAIGANATLEEVRQTMGGGRQETWSISGEVFVRAKSWQGSTEATIKAARDDAIAIFALVETYLNDTYSGPLPHVEMTAGEMVNEFNPDGRFCSIGFTMQLRGVKNP